MATIYGVTAVVLWGLLALLGNMTKGIPAFQLLFLCFITSTAIMFLSRLLRGLPIFSLPRLSCTQWLVGISGLFGFHFCYFMALKLAPAIEVSLIAYLWPLLLSVMLSNRMNRLNVMFGGILGFIGVTVTIVANGKLSMNSSAVAGYLLALLCAVIWSIYSWHISKTPGRIDDLGWLSLAVAGLALVAHFSWEPVSWHFSGNEWFGIALLGLGPVGGAFYLWDMGMKYGDRQLLASLSFSAPLISSIALAVAGMNDWSTDIVIALVLIMLGAFIANRRSPSPNRLKQS